MRLGIFIAREEKAEWGFPCNQSANGRLWAGKGYRRPLKGQFGEEETQEIADAITKGRGDRNGRFWVDRENRIVTMMIGESHLNRYKQVKY